MNPVIFIVLMPCLVITESFWFTYVTMLLREPSDAAVGAGLVLLIGGLAVNFYLFKYLKTKLSNP